MRFVLGSILSAVVLFLWGYLYWGILPISKQVIQAMPAGDDVSAVLQEKVGKTGVYYLPGLPSDESNTAAMEAFVAKHEAGPVAMLFYRQQGATPMSPRTLAAGFVHSLLVTVIAGILLIAAAPSTYPNRVLLIVWAGIFCTVWVHISQVVWYYYPWNFCFLYMVYHVVGALLVGLIMAAFVKPTE